MIKPRLGFEAARVAILAAGLALISGCGGGGSGSSAVPSTGGAGNVVPGGGNTTVSSIVIPSQASVSPAGGTRKAQYVTSQTNGVIVYSWSGAQPASPSPVAQGDWSSTSALCTAASGGRTCSISFNAPVSTSNTTIVVDVYDKAPAGCGSNGFCNGGAASGSHLISVGVQTGQTIVANGSNQVTVQTSGVLASIQIGVSAGAVTATGLDADGMAINGPCLDGSTPLAMTPITGITLTPNGFSFSGSATYAASTCSATGASLGSSSGFITASAASSKGTLSSVTGYDVVSNGSGTSGPVSTQTVTAAGGTIGFTPSNSSSNSSSNFGGGSFSFGVPSGGVSGSATVTIAEVASTTLSAFIPASNMRNALYTSGGTTNPNVVFYSFALAVGGGTLTSSLQVGGTLYVTNGAIADALGSSGTLYVATAPSAGATPVDVGSIAYTYFASGAMASDPTGSCSAAGIDTSCLVLGTFAPVGGRGIMASGVYMLYLPASVIVTGTACGSTSGGNTCTTSALSSSASVTISQPGPDGTTFSLSSDTCSGVVSFPSSLSTNSGSATLTPGSGPLNASCQITVASSAGGTPATINVSVSVSPPAPSVSVQVGAPSGTNYSGIVWQQAAHYFVLGSSGTVPITFTGSGTSSSLTLSLAVTTPSGHLNTGLTSSTFQLTSTSLTVPTSGSTSTTLSYTGDGQYKTGSGVSPNGAAATITITGPSGFTVSLDSSLNSAALLSAKNSNGTYTLTVNAACLSMADDNAGNNENLALDVAEDKTPAKKTPLLPGCP